MRRFVMVLITGPLLALILSPQTAQAKQPLTQREKPAPTYADVSYGSHRRQVMDVWLAKSDTPTPMVVYIHGGGFVGGGKNSINRFFLNAALDAGISVASIHYRFVTEVPFPAPQQDGARAIQFLRWKARDWNLDPARFAAFGGSAGAGISMWLAFHDDMANPAADDPVLQQSTRLCAVGSFGGQTSYDPKIIKEWIGGKAYQHPSIYLCYRIASIEEIAKPELQSLYDEVSAIKHLSKDDPPIYMYYNEPDGPLPENARPGQGIHHPIFGYKLRDAMQELEIEAVYRHSSTSKANPAIELLEFFQKHFDQVQKRS